MNLQMPALKRCLETAGFTNVKTVLSSGNVVFDAPSSPSGKLEAELERALEKAVGRRFLIFVRSVASLERLLESEPYSAFRLPRGSKRVVTFLRTKRTAKLKLPIAFDGARILAISGAEVLSAYVPRPSNPAFMRLIEKTFGNEVTTRTWETVTKVSRA